VSTGDIYWPPLIKGDLINVVLDNTPKAHGLAPIKIVFTNKGKQDTTWKTGKTWGLRLYTIGYPGGLFTITL
jgi:hypothetical protein